MINKICAVLLMLAIGSSVAARGAETYLLGVVLPLTGDKADTGQSLLKAVKLAVREVEQAQGIRFKLAIKDDQNKPEAAEQAARELVRDPALIGVLGHYYSSTAMGAIKVYDEARVPVLCVYASDPQVGASSPWVFGMNYSNTRQAEHIAVYLKEILKKDNILLINNTDAYGLSLRDAFTHKAQRIGLTIRRHLEYDHIEKFGDDFLAANLPDPAAREEIGAAVIFAHSDSGIKLVKQARALGLDALIVGPNTWATSKFLDEKVIGEEQSRNVYVASPFLWELANKDAARFDREFQRAYGETPDITAPMCADAVLLFADAVAKQGADREKIRNYLSGLNWTTAVAGMTGNLCFDAQRMMDRDVFISEIKDGRFKVAYVQITLPREPYVFEEKNERLKKGYLLEVDGQLYHWVDVVFVGVDFIRINDVNTQKMTFDLDFFLWFKWMGDKVNVEEIGILNAFAGRSTLLKETLGGPVKYRCYRYNGSYIQPYNLAEFPFDRQELPIVLGHKTQNSAHLMLAPDTRHMTREPVKEIYPQEWVYCGKESYSGIHRFDSTFGDPDYRLGKGYKSKIYFSTVTIQIMVKRILFPYIFNTFLPLLVILVITVLIFRIPVDQFSLRFNLSMSALLSVLVYHLAQKSALPRVGYLMKVDYYFIGAYLFMLVLVCMNVLVMIWVLKDKKEAAARLNHRFNLFFLPATALFYILLTVFK